LLTILTLNKIHMKKIFTFLLISTSFAGFSQFADGNIIVSSNIETNNSGAHRTLSLQEYTTSGVVVGTLLNTGRKTDDRRVAHEGQLSTSASSNCVVLAGRDVAEGTAFGPARNPGTLSVIRISKDKTIAYTNFTSTDGGYVSFNGEGVRAVASVDGSSYYVATGGNVPLADKGTRIVTHGNVTSTTQHSDLQNRNVNISGTDVLTISQANPGALTINGVVTPLGAGGSGDGLVTALMFDVDATIAGNDLLYIANRNSGILKYAKSASGSWDYVGITNNVAESSSGFVSMCGRIEAGKPVLYAIKIDAAAPNANSWLYKVTDNAGRTVDWNSGGLNNATHTLLLTSNTATAQTFRGVTFAPTQTLSISSFAQNSKKLVIYTSNDGSLLNISNNNDTISVEVYNTLGQKIMSGSSQGDLQLDITTLSSGTYIVRSKDGETAKFIK